MDRRKIGTYLSYLLAAILLLPAIANMLHLEPLASTLAKNHVGDWTRIIGLGLFVSAILFAYPKTKNVGTLLLSSYMGGAIVFHMSLGEPFIFQSLLLIAIWVIAWMRDSKIITGE